MKQFLPYLGRLTSVCGLALIFAQYSAADTTTNLESEIHDAAIFFQPLESVGSVPPTDEENQVLAGNIKNIKEAARGISSGVPALEAFVKTYPRSSWTPSLEANLGRYYYGHARYTDAIQELQTAWDATKTAGDGPAKEVADYSFAYLTKILVAMGQVDELKPLLEETTNRNFGDQANQSIVGKTRAEYKVMVAGSDISFRCGAYALKDMLRASKIPANKIPSVMTRPSPVTGFSLRDLVELAGKAGASVVAADWGSSETPVAPSVIHWRQNHYAAILAETNGMYEVVDLALGRSVWLSVSEIRAEASGHFIVLRDKLPPDWKELTLTEAQQVYGRGWIDAALDNNDYCPTCPSPGGGSGNGDPNSGCPSCSGGNRVVANVASDQNPHGMPIWEVHEPFINTWLYDEPLGYQPGAGDRISFDLYYKQRNVSDFNETPITVSPNIFSVGNSWNCSWISFIEDDGETNGSSYTATMFVPGGGIRFYVCDNTTTEYYSQTLMQRTVNASGQLTGFIVTYPSGAADYYTNIAKEYYDGVPVAFLSSKVDPYGHTTHFKYLDSGTYFTLQSVTDADGQVSMVTYGNASAPTLITQITDPFGHSAHIGYNSENVINQITDVANTSSTVQYNWQGWVTNLTTPYGQTSFQYATTNDYWGYTDWGPINNPTYGAYSLLRGVKVVDPLGGTNVYMLRQDSSAVSTDGGNSFVDYLAGNGYGICDVYNNCAIPATSPCDTDYSYLFSVDANLLYYRDSFHWGPLQAVTLPNDIFFYGTSDLLKARMRHWLHDGNTGAISPTLSMEQAPSPDGTTWGQTTWYGYDGQGSSYWSGFDPFPSVIAQVVPDGTTHYTMYERDQFDRATNVVETFSVGYGVTPLTRTNVTYYSANGIDLVQNVGPLGEVLAGYGYNANHQITSFTNALNEVTHYNYDAQGRLTSTISPAGLTTTNIYPSSGLYTNFVKTTIDLQIQRTNSYTYTNDLVYTHTDERNLTTTNLWDALSRLIRVGYPDGTFVTNSYTILDLTQVKDRMGFTNSYGYDALRHLVAATNANGAVTLYDYCPCGALDAVQDAMGNVTYYSYDNAGDVTNVLYPDNYWIGYSYDLMGHQIGSVDSGGKMTVSWYNNQGKRYAVDNNVGQVSYLIFDAEDRITNSVDINNVSTGTSLDALGRVVSRTYPDKGVEGFGYTLGFSGPTSHTDQIGDVTLYGFDAANRKTNEIQVAISTNTFAYNAASDLTTLIDGNGHPTTWGYDVYGRVTNKVDAASELLFVYNYDPDNRLTNRWSAAKGNTGYSYDAVGNLTHVIYPVSLPITLGYDALNRLTNMVDAIGATVYAYDAVGQVLSEDGPWPNDTVSYSYANRLRMNLGVQAPNETAWSQNYGYDSARRLTGISSPVGTFGYVYDPVQLARVDQVNLPGGLFITDQYDTVARQTLTELRNSSGTDFDSYAYKYNQANQRTNVTRTLGDYVNYTYDKAGEVQSVMALSANGVTNRAQEMANYSYDGAGNILLRRVIISTTDKINYQVNALNEITNTTFGGPNGLGAWTAMTTVAGWASPTATNVTVNGSTARLYEDKTYATNAVLVSPGTTTFTAVAKDALNRTATYSSTVNIVTNNGAYKYDLNGNLLYDGYRGFAYDDENQLISVWLTNVWRSDFAYDGKMRRRVKTDYYWTNGSWIPTNQVLFVYDGNVVVQERNPNGIPVVTYTRGLDLSGTLQGAGGIGGLLARTDMGQLIEGTAFAHALYHSDANGNVTCLIYPNQSIAAKYLYDAFGATLGQYGSLADANAYRFSSKEWNAYAGLYYYLYRFYDPNLQRWINRDPLTDFGSITYDQIPRRGGYKLFLKVEHQPNGYEFIDNKPTAAVDLFGLQSWMGPGFGSMGPDGPGGSGNYSNKPGCPCGNGGTYQSYASQSFGGNISACAESLWSQTPPQSWPAPVQIVGGAPIWGKVGIGGNSIGGAATGGLWGASAVTYAEARLFCETLKCVGGNSPSSPPSGSPFMPPSICSTCVVNNPTAF